MSPTDATTATKTWFITGSSSGIGHELAAAALAQGDNVTLASRTTQSGDELAGAFPQTALALAVDVRDEKEVQDAVDATVARFGTIDVVANNAGYGLFGAVEESTDAQARAVFDTNVFGVLNVLRAVLPVLRAQNSGHILQGSSLYGQFSHPGVGLLSATKYAVEGLSDALVEELAPLGIHVTLVQPGGTNTPFLANLAFAENTFADYDQTVRAVQKAIGDAPADAGVNPRLLALALIAAVNEPNPPYRLALGETGAGAMRSALTARIADLDRWDSLTSSADEVSQPVAV